MITMTYYGKMHIHKNNDIISKSLEMYGEWAKNEILFISELMLQDGDTILDIGAHIGSYSLALNHLMGGSCKIVSIEPDINNFEILMKNVNIVNSDSITIFNKSTKIDVDSAKFLNSSVTDYGQRRVISNKNAMDDTLMIELIKESNLIKIDIEGSELFFLKSFSNNINTEKNKFIIEVLDILQAWEVSKLFMDKQMKVFGMQVKAFNDNNYLGNSKNIFGGGTEFSIIVVPVNFEIETSKLDSQIYLINEINKFEDLLQIMLLQPQLWSKIIESKTKSNIPDAVKKINKHAIQSIMDYWVGKL